MVWANLIEKFLIGYNWISEESGWIAEPIDAEYVNISIYSPLSGSSYIELPDKLRTQKKI